MYKIPPGVFDVIPEDEKEPWKSSYLRTFVEEEIRILAKEFGYEEIRTPLFERAELFERGVGEGSDIVSKEMYTFKDKGDRLLSLRPEGTAPVIRAFIENNMAAQGNIHKLFYIGPMFRYERSQAGRYRQHHQFGVEAIGNGDPEQDVEVISMIFTLFKRLHLSELSVCLNTIGDKESRDAFRIALKEYLEQYKSDLSEDSLKRLESNPLRILDSKDPGDKKIVESAPSILNYLNEKSLKHFERVKELLSLLQIPFVISDKLVRGLDYYNHTVFEVVSGQLGAHNSLVGGGRYDGLIKTLGGPDLPAMGFGAGIERILQTMLKQTVPLPERNRPLLFFIPLDDKAKEKCFALTYTLRCAGIPVQMDFGGRKLNKTMQYADKIRASYVAIVGSDELEKGKVELKNMQTGHKSTVPFESLERIMKIEAEKTNYLKTLCELNKPFHTSEEQSFFVEQLSSSIKETNSVTKNLANALKNMEHIIEN